ncbi:MAG: hypothetical protein HYW45_02330 [Candidatus Daviesbacteria bacterium]|nr:MAG: hypothetical protein HYW45_02330 [Candidatus Daviesbacteria bacterium]
MVKELSVKELPLALQAEVIPLPKIVNTWSGEGQETFHRVQLQHNDSAADPKSKCSGLLSIILSPSDRGTKTTSCQSCRQQVPVSLFIVKLELGLK